uniref:CBFD_NFYB_HMF domain-containing protein n=1 Tax=Syphacia muris TaxID=451379 RepID=A0A0N5AE90_9BILA
MEYNNSDKFILPALPLTKVKRICKLDAEVNSVSTQAVTLIAMATENFIKILSVEAYRRALFCDRRTLLSKDIGDVQVEDAGKNNESEAMESTEVVESVPSEDVKESPVRTNDV